jgi:hypothetical protein
MYEYTVYVETAGLSHVPQIYKSETNRWKVT